MAGFFSSVWFSIRTVINTFTWRDALDILLVTYLVYSAINLLIHSRTGLLIKGILLLMTAYLLANILGLKTIKYIIDYAVKYGLLVLVVIFQPELRSILERIGRTEFGLSVFSSLKGGSSQATRSDIEQALEAICNAAESMSRAYTGALIVFEKDTPLNDIIATGTGIDARISEELVGNIFYKGSPLHDGAMVVRDGRMTAAGCILPVSHNLDISKEMGTRHRAALGISEATDAVVLVVSEENGYISIAQGGGIKRHLSRNGAYRILADQLVPKKEETEKKGRAKRFLR